MPRRYIYFFVRFVDAVHLNFSFLIFVAECLHSVRQAPRKYDLFNRNLISALPGLSECGNDLRYNESVSSSSHKASPPRPSHLLLGPIT
jgi:hypothetical protein